jgi:hypothetical protein
VDEAIQGRQDAAMPYAAGSRIVQSASVVYSEHDAGALLLDVTADRRVLLDAFGGRVWVALGDAPTLAELFACLQDDGTPAERLAEDVTRLLARWRDQGLIRWR